MLKTLFEAFETLSEIDDILLLALQANNVKDKNITTQIFTLLNYHFLSGFSKFYLINFLFLYGQYPQFQQIYLVLLVLKLLPMNMLENYR